MLDDVRSTNPVLKNLTNEEHTAGYSYAPEIQQDRPLTVDDIVSKTGITIAVIILFAAINFGIYLSGNAGVGMILTLVGGIGAFVVTLVHAFSRTFGSRTVTLLYAAFEGLFLGGFSLLISGWFSVGGADAGQMIFQAILGTLGVFIGMLVVYRTGAIRVTPRLNRLITGAIFGVVIMALGNLLLALFTGQNPLRDGGTMSIIFGVVCVVLAAISFLQDFDLADRLVRTSAPSNAAWGVALGLAVTLVWLYTEILRLLSYFANDR